MKSPRHKAESKRIQQRLIQICPELFSGYPIEFAYLYGSYATGLAHPFSDIDIGIYLNKSINKKDYLKIELQVGLKLDETLDCVAQSEVRIINVLPLMIRGEMVTDGILIYSINEKKRVEHETIIRSEYFDFLPVIKAYQKEYISRNRSQ